MIIQYMTKTASKSSFFSSFMKLLLISVLFLNSASCKRTFIKNEGSTWGTNYHIVYQSDRDLHDSVIAVMRSVDASLSKFNPDSEISRINSGITDSVGKMMADVFAVASHVAGLSDGVYDPTVGPVCELWGFGIADFTSVPTDSAIAAALGTVGILDCHITGNKIVKKNPATEFDFSSVAKGYGIDCIADMLERNGVENYMIEIGGEISACGLSPRECPWRIQVDAPEIATGPADIHSRLSVLELGPERIAVATSGNYRNIRSTTSGESFGHTISPVTGRPAKSEILSATVIDADCALADAMATACMASPTVAEALDMAERAGLYVLLITADTDSTFAIHTNRPQ